MIVNNGGTSFETADRCLNLQEYDEKVVRMITIVAIVIIIIIIIVMV